MTDQNNQDMEEEIIGAAPKEEQNPAQQEPAQPPVEQPQEPAPEEIPAASVEPEPAPVEEPEPQPEPQPQTPPEPEPEPEENALPKVKASNFSKNQKAPKPKVIKHEKGDSFSPKEKMKSWYYARYQSVVVQRNILLLFSLLSMVAVTVSVVFVRSVTASKSLDPYVIEIEEKTGVPVVVEQLSSQYLTGNQMIVRYFLNQFIHAASGYDPRLYKLNSTKMRLFSTPAVYNDFRRRIDPRDLGNESSIQVRIKSIQFPGPNIAQIRLLRVIKRENRTQTVNELINMEFRFDPAVTLTTEERLINPLGFQVGRYMITEEIYEY